MSVRNLLDKFVFITIIPFIILLIYLAITSFFYENFLIRSDAIERMNNVKIVILEHLNQNSLALQMLAKSPLISPIERMDLFYEQAKNYK